MQAKVVALNKEEPITMQERFTIEIDKIKERHGDRKKRRGTAVFEIAKREHVKVFVSCQKLIPVDILILGL